VARLRRYRCVGLQGLTFGWYVLGYSPSSWSSVAGSLWNEKSAHVLAGEEMRLFEIGPQRTDANSSNYSGLLMRCMHMH
jgi:hypothetical protein